ncbi:MAG: hypothetical protein J6A88_06765 [Oscillospiraceae bacterium]|nr:hypothetical protein [Oscillospiraceae bacterium]
MTEQKNHKVFEFAFEDTPELIIDKYYIIKLDLMMRPEEEFVVRTYCGTLEEIGKLINSLDQNEWNRHYYESTIAAWEAWQEGDKMALHHVGANVEPLLIPAKELCRSAYLLDEAQWSYTDKFGCTMLASADTADVHQVLLYRGRFFRFARYQFGGLCRVHSDNGWVDYQVDDGGVPGMIYKTENGEIHSRLYMLVDEFSTYQAGVDAMQSDYSIDYNKISQEIFVR